MLRPLGASLGRSAAALRSPAAALSGPWRGMLATRAVVTPDSVCREWAPASRRVGAVGMKCGMTQAWSASGQRIPITVIELQDLQVSKVRVPMSDGVCALQLAGGWEKRKRMTTAEARNYEAKGLAYKRYMREFPVTEDALLPVGTTITALHFSPGQFVDVQATTRGKGFQGVVRRWGFKGQSATHGTTKAERKPGSMGGSAGSMFATRIFKGKRMVTPRRPPLLFLPDHLLGRHPRMCVLTRLCVGLLVRGRREGWATGDARCRV